MTVFKEVHRDGVPTLDRSADIKGEKGKYAAFLKLPLFPFSPSISALRSSVGHLPAVVIFKEVGTFRAIKRK